MRSKILKDKVSALNEAERKGIEKGHKEGEKSKAIEVAKNLIGILDDETIAKITGLDLDEIKLIRDKKQ